MNSIIRLIAGILLACCMVDTMLARKTIYVTPGAFGDIFNPNPAIGNAQISCCRLKEALGHLGYDICQRESIKSLVNPDYILFFDISTALYDLGSYDRSKAILFLWEPPTVNSANYDTRYHQFFSKIFTWRDDLVDGVQYLKFHYPQPTLVMCEPVVEFNQKKLCVMVAGNRGSHHADELYSARKRDMLFFEYNAPHTFDLYGPSWPNELRVYRGKTSDKIACLQKYKFCICYENIALPGYVTEKIFDCFVAGCVPIYQGAPNIDEYVPRDCFIDRTQFFSMHELYKFLQNMSQADYEGYLARIRAYLSSEQAQKFSSDYFIKTVVEGLGLEATGGLHEYSN